MKRLALLLLLLCGVAQAAAPARAIDPRGSNIRFTFSQENVPANGSFGKFSGTVALDPASAQAIALSVDIGSIDAGSDDANTEVVKPTWLSAKLFPQATFASKTLTDLGGGRWQAQGPLTIKGVAHNVSVPFTVKEQPGGGAQLDGHFQLKRADFKVGEGEWSTFDVVANEVNVSFHLVLASATH